MVHVYVSRYSQDLHPGEGDLINWEIGETVRIVGGVDDGKRFVVTSERMTHPAYSEGYVREGHLVGETEIHARPETRLWFDADRPTLERVFEDGEWKFVPTVSSP